MKTKKCICTADLTDWPVIPNPDCPIHGGLHGNNPYKEMKEKIEDHDCEEWRTTDLRLGHDECWKCGKVLPPRCPRCGGKMVYNNQCDLHVCEDCGSWDGR